MNNTTTTTDTTVFTTSQSRRNDKAIAAAIAEHGDTLTLDRIEAIADELSGKYLWSVRKEAMRDLVIRRLALHLEQNSGEAEATDDSDDAHPLYKQWQQLKAQRPSHIMLIRLGDFYEAFESDAVVVAEVCDQVLTARDVSPTQRVPLSGVPYRNADKYIAQLVQAGHKVAIAEQMESTSTEIRPDVAPAPVRIVASRAPVAEVPVPVINTDDDERERELLEEIEELQDKVRELTEQLTEAETWRKAWEYLEEVQHHASSAVPVVNAIDRATFQLSCDGWSDTYVQKDISDAMAAALLLCEEAADMYDNYLSA